MPVFRALPHYARLRRLPNDPRLHVTVNGFTRSGELAGAGLSYRSEDVPYLALELDNADPFEPTVPTWQTLEIRSPDLYTADVDALAPHAERDHVYQALQDCCATFRDLMNDRNPECQHEDVIETPQLGETAVRGICVWCPVPLVKENDEWVPAPVQDGA